ncbi:MAG: TIM barrel protein [bacterium]|nr:TIM barrel protein [bacterium]
MELGTIVSVSGEIKEVEKAFYKVKKLGLNTCQLSCTAESMIDKLNPKEIKKLINSIDIRVDSFFLLFRGQVWDRDSGPQTMGFIPKEYRMKRLDLAKKFSDIIAEMGIKKIVSHVGFIPDDSENPLYTGFLPVMRNFTEYCKKNKQIFCFETGQELPSTLKRTIIDLDMDNIGINLDPANLILYGMAHPIDAVEIFGEYIKSMHAKDALFPNRGEGLGIEVPVGEGKVNFPLLI